MTNILKLNNIDVASISEVNSMALSDISNIYGISVSTSPYAFNLDLSTFKDTVTGQSLSCNIDGTRYDEVDGVTTAFGTDVPTIADNGLRICGAYSNIYWYSNDVSKISAINGCTYNDGVFSLPESGDPYIRINSYYMTYPNLGVGTKYYASLRGVTGTGDFSNWKFATSGGIAEEWIQPNISLSATNQTINFKIDFNNADHTGFLGRSTYINGTATTINAFTVMIADRGYNFPLIPTTGSPVSSPSEAGNSSTGTGIWIDDVQTKHPLLYNALIGEVESGVRA